MSSDETFDQIRRFFGRLDQQDMKLGEIYPEIGFITQSALANGGVEIENTGSEPLVLTFDFRQ